MIRYDNVNIWYSYCHRRPCERAIWPQRSRNPWVEKHWLTLKSWLYYWKQEQLHHLAEHETESVMSPHWCTRRDKQLRCSIPVITGPQLSNENVLSTLLQCGQWSRKLYLLIAPIPADELHTLLSAEDNCLLVIYYRASWWDCHKHCWVKSLQESTAKSARQFRLTSRGSGCSGNMEIMIGIAVSLMKTREPQLWFCLGVLYIITRHLRSSSSKSIMPQNQWDKK